MQSRIASTSCSNDGASTPQNASIDAAPSKPTSPTSMNQNLDRAANTSAAHPPVKCPRCDSLNTKFCYYNNYSQTQPRHFCKTCRRYWTEGGTLRNVPVGGGCRKNKRVKQRPLLNLGAPTAGLLDPSTLIDDTTSNMLATLSNISPFPNMISSGASIFDDNDTNTQLLNISFSCIQESMQPHRQQPLLDPNTETMSSYFDMSFPALVHKQSTPASYSCGAYGSGAHSIHHGTWPGPTRALERNLGFRGMPIKMERDFGMANFCNSGYELNPMIYQDQSVGMAHVGGTSTTASDLASMGDQLSSFSNLQHVATFDTDAPTTLVEENSYGGLIEGLTRNMVSEPHELLEHVQNAADVMVEPSFEDEAKERLMQINMLDEKPLLNTANNNVMQHIAADSDWQTPSVMINDLLLEPHHDM